jgi:hypothetical protein
MADAKKAGVNKSEEIRSVATEMKAKGEKPRPVAIIAALQSRGISVSSPQVSIVLKKMGFRPTRGRKVARGGRKAAAVKPVSAVAARSSVVTIEDILAAKKVAQQLGGTDRALAALAALKRIES